VEVNILIGGAAGQGMETVMTLLGKTLVREGYGIIYSKDYMSRVRGGHNFSRLRIASDSPWTTIESADILVALNEETYDYHRELLSPSGKIAEPLAARVLGWRQTLPEGPVDSTAGKCDYPWPVGR